VRQVLVERHARGHARLLQLDDHQRQAVDEADRGKSEVRSPIYELQSVRHSKLVIRHFLRAPVTLNWLTSRKSLFAGCPQSITRKRSVFCPPPFERTPSPPASAEALAEVDRPGRGLG